MWVRGWGGRPGNEQHEMRTAAAAWNCTQVVDVEQRAGWRGWRKNLNTKIPTCQFAMNIRELEDRWKDLYFSFPE